MQFPLFCQWIHDDTGCSFLKCFLGDWDLHSLRTAKRFGRHGPLGCFMLPRLSTIRIAIPMQTPMMIYWTECNNNNKKNYTKHETIKIKDILSCLSFKRWLLCFSHIINKASLQPPMCQACCIRRECAVEASVDGLKRLLLWTTSSTNRFEIKTVCRLGCCCRYFVVSIFITCIVFDACLMPSLRGRTPKWTVTFLNTSSSITNDLKVAVQ